MSGSSAVEDSCHLGCDTMYIGIWHIHTARDDAEWRAWSAARQHVCRCSGGGELLQTDKGYKWWTKDR